MDVRIYLTVAAVLFCLGVFGVITVATMTAAVMVALTGLRSIRLKGLERYAHAFAGAAILVCGLLMTAVVPGDRSRAAGLRRHSGEVFDIHGRKVAGRDLVPGVYFVRALKQPGTTKVIVGR